MGIDRTGAGTDNPEAAGKPPPPDRRPPPDRPGAEGAPSRADSRNGAAAANNTDQQATDEAREQKPDTTQPSQGTSGEQGATAVEDKPETPATSELSEGESSSKDDGVSGERHDTGHAEVETADRPEAEQASAETSNTGDIGGQEQAPDGQATPQDSTNETEQQSTPTDATGQTEGKAAEETPSAENGEPASADTSFSQDHADITDSAPRQAEDAVSAPETRGAPRESVDAPRDVAVDEAREQARPAADISEAAAAAGEAEDGPQITEKPQPDADAPPHDDALPVAEASKDDRPHPDTPPIGRADEISEAGESATETDAAVANSTEKVTRRADSPEDEATPKDERGAEAAGSVGEDKGLDTVDGVKDQSPGEDPVPAWTDGVEKLSDLPTGAELLNMENDKLSRFEKLRREGYKQISDGLDVTGKGFDLGAGAFARPPTHTETRPAQPEVVEAPHHAVTAGEAATGLLVVGVVIGELFRWGRGKLTQRKGR